MGYYLGIDFGGTGIKIGLVSPDKKVIKKIILKVPEKPAPEKVGEAIREKIKTEFFRYKIVRAGCGICGDIDYRRGLVRFSPNLKWQNVSWGQILRTKLGLAIRVENDANAAAWGARIKRFPGAKNLVGITLGTGVGGGIICGGEIYRGSSGTAGEIGHLSIEVNGPECSCGSRGCLEAYIGARALSRYAQARINRGEKSLLSQYSEITPAVIYQAASSGDKLAKSVFEYLGRILGVALADILNILNPEIIVLMGGVSRAGKFFLPGLKQTLRARSFTSAYRRAKIVLSDNADEPGIVGAAFLHLSN